MVLQPRYCLNNIGLGCSAFARHYLRNHFCFLLLWVLRCFSSPRSLSLRNDWPSTSRVAPFGNLGIKGYLHLPQAYRSLSRPSSPPRAKASTVCPCLLSVSMTPTFYKVRILDWYIFSLLLLFSLLNFFWSCPIRQRSYLHHCWCFMWRITDSNRWPSACKADALASWANPP